MLGCAVDVVRNHVYESCALGNEREVVVKVEETHVMSDPDVIPVHGRVEAQQIAATHVNRNVGHDSTVVL